MKKLAPGEKLLDWWKDEAKETKAAKSGGVVALPVSREEGVVIGGEGEEMEEGEAEVEGEEEFLGGLGAWRGRTTLALRLKDGQAMEMGVEQEQNGEDDGDDDDEGEAVDDKRLVDEDA